MQLFFINIQNKCEMFTCCSGIFSSIKEIFHENGILGFFNGVVPRMLGEVASIFIASSLTFVVNCYLVDDQELKKFSAAFMTVSTWPLLWVKN
jgi:carrier protein